MTSKHLPTIILRRAKNQITLTTGLLKAATPISVGDSGIFVMKTKEATGLIVHTLRATQEIPIVAEGRITSNTFGGAEARWYLLDKAAIKADSPLAGYSGFCFVGHADAIVGGEDGFIPYGETEVMIDANGDKFLVIRSET